MNIRRITIISIIGLFLATILLSFVPVIQTSLKVRGEWNGVPPAYIDDDLYYYGRIKEVIDGKPFLGNPYFIEYRDVRAVAFFVTDWIASIPFLLGIPFSAAVVLNFVFWSFLFVFLAYLVGRATDMSPPYSAGLAFLAYCEVYWLIFRPVVMQEVFPFFLLFILALLLWLRNPLRWRSVCFLIIASALSFYIYAYLWQIICTILGIVFLHTFVQKKWPEIKKLLLVTLGTGLLALPAIIYTIYQIRAPFYWETVGRIGLVESHIPTIDAYLYGRWAILLVVLYLCAHKWLKTRTSVENGNSDLACGEPAESVTLAAIYSGFGLFIMSISNVLTGKDVATAQHIGRFITLWVALFLPILIWKLWIQRKEASKLHWLKPIIMGILLLACLGFLGLNLKRSLPFQRIAAVDAVTVQGYAEPLNWLEQQEKQPVVIWANEDISTYVPILTKHYVFWSHFGGLHLMPTKEVEDRFLASRIGLLTKDMAATMKRYHVSYLIADIKKGEDNYFKSLPGATEVWRNNGFIIYKVQ